MALADGFRLPGLLPELREVLDELAIDAEILVATVAGDPAIRQAADKHDARLIEASGLGYGSALIAAISAAQGAYLLTMDADLMGRPTFIRDLWLRRLTAEVNVASRYVPGGRAEMPGLRYWPSRLLNKVFGRGLSLPFRDLSSGFRLYAAQVLKGHTLQSKNLSLLQEIMVRIYADGWRVQEVPFVYRPWAGGGSRANAFRFALDYVTTFVSLWKLRNSILSADYDDRAHDSLIPLQRYWQRSRFRHVVELIAGEGAVLDVGCGSSRIIGALPPGSVALDVLVRKLRYARRFGVPLVHGSGFELPFPDASFSCVVCSQVIEHVPMDSPILDELVRVLKPGGRLVLGTPDYSRWEWVVTERLYGWFAPGAYADEHIAHYTREGLIADFARRGFTHEATRYIMRGELILAFRKGK